MQMARKTNIFCNFGELSRTGKTARRNSSVITVGFTYKL